MNDAVFKGELFRHGLLPGDLKDQLSTQSTKANKATYFLDCAINPGVSIGISSSFDNLLNVMEGSEFQAMKELAKQIKSDMREKPNNNPDNGLRISYRHTSSHTCI